MKYKLIKEYPGSPELGSIALPYGSFNTDAAHYIVPHPKCENADLAISKDHIENNPEYWENVEELVYMVSSIDMAFRNAWEVVEVGSIHYKNTDSKNYFKTKEEAEQYIIKNKPCLTLNDVGLILGGLERKRDVFLELKRIVKSRL